MEFVILGRLSSWVFVYKLSGCGFDSRCYHLKEMIKMIKTTTRKKKINKKKLIKICQFQIYTALGCSCIGLECHEALEYMHETEETK